MTNELKSKKEIIKGLLLTEKDTLDRLKELIEKTKSLIRIDEKSKKIVLQLDVLNVEKILLLLIGKYFSKELGISNTEGMDINDLEKESGIKKTTLSKPLLQLCQSGYITQDDEKRYFMQHYKIEEVINALSGKYIEKRPDAKGIKSQYRPKKKRKGGTKKDVS